MAQTKSLCYKDVESKYHLAYTIIGLDASVIEIQEHPVLRNYQISRLFLSSGAVRNRTYRVWESKYVPMWLEIAPIGPGE